MNSLRILIGWIRRKPATQTMRLSEPPGWSFETTTGSGYVMVVVRDLAGKLIHTERVDTGRMRNLLVAAAKTIIIADRIEPSILKMPVRGTTRPVLRLVRVGD